MITTRFIGEVTLISELPIEKVGDILGEQIFGGLKFGGKDRRIYDEVPAIFIENGLLGFSVILQEGVKDNRYYLELIPMHHVKECGGSTVKLSYYRFHCTDLLKALLTFVSSMNS